MNYSIRRLNENDLSSMRELNTLFADVFEDPENYSSNIPNDEYIVSFLRDENNVVLVAAIDERVVGGLVGYVLTKFEMERKEIYLYDLAVSTQYQRMGIGKKLIEELRDAARSLGAYVVFLQADEGDDAIAFYESLAPDENIRTRSFDYRVG